MNTSISRLPRFPTDAAQTCHVSLGTGLLAVQGPDAIKFLQGQVTCDLRELADRHTRLGAHCTPKGRMLASFRALQRSPEELWLLMPREQVEDTRAALGKYIVFSKAKLVDLSAAYTSLGVIGPGAAQVLRNQLGELPVADGDWLEGGDFWILRRHEARFECGFSAVDDPRLIALRAATEALDENAWTLADIREGLGQVRQATRELFTPQAINFQFVNGINFRKGCYTGQEIVARLHYRGQLKRHMYRFAGTLSDDVPLPEPGSRLINAAGQPQGEVVIAAWAGPGCVELLANTGDNQLEDSWLPGSTPKKLEPLPLPYAIPTANDT